MPLLRRAAPLDLTDGELGGLVRRGLLRIERCRLAHAEQWGLGSQDGWELDHGAAVLRWTFADRVVEAPAQVLATHQVRAGRWRWAWADRIVPTSMTADARAVRTWATEHAERRLLAGELPADEPQAERLVALGAEVAGVTGLFRGHSGRSEVYLTFGDVTVAHPS